MCCRVMLIGARVPASESVGVGLQWGEVRESWRWSFATVQVRRARIGDVLRWSVGPFVDRPEGRTADQREFAGCPVVVMTVREAWEGSSGEDSQVLSAANLGRVLEASARTRHPSLSARGRCL